MEVIGGAKKDSGTDSMKVGPHLISRRPDISNAIYKQIPNLHLTKLKSGYLNL